MLTLDPARGRVRSGGSIGLALAGGGPLGAFYELGALHALAEAIDGLDLTALDVYVGVSSGSMIAAALANGFDTTSMGSIFITNDSTLYPFAPSAFVRPAVREYLRRAARLPALLGQAVRDYARDPMRALWADTIASLGKAMPVAAFDNSSVRDFIRRLFCSPGHTDDFRRLRARLYVVATNLNTGTSVRFGEPRFAHVPISTAVMASTALPGLYPPVEIEGEHYVDGALIRTMNASIAFEAGCDLVICVNPLVAFDASRAGRAARVDLSRAALPTILSQTFRALIQSRMHVGIASYRSRFPKADLLLLEPDRYDEQMFFVNVFRFRERQRLVDHAYQRTRADLRHQFKTLEPVLARHGLRLRRAVLLDRGRSFATAIRERARASRRVTRDLAETLDRLERTLAVTHGVAGVRVAAAAR